MLQPDQQIAGDVPLTTETWIIRPANDRDQLALADLYLRMRRATFTWVDPGHFHIEDFATQSQGETIIVCELAKEIIGFIAFWPPDDFIHMLYITSEYQGQGIGSMLLHALPGWPRRRYRLKCLVKNAAARRFYQSVGFLISGSGTSSEGDYNDMTLGAAVKRR